MVTRSGNQPHVTFGDTGPRTSTSLPPGLASGAVIS
jgi:hypothetical protein